MIAVLVDLPDTIYPAILGLGLMSGGVWLLAYASNHQVYSANALIFVGIAAALGMAMDYVSGVLGVKYTDASKQTLWGAFINGITGAFLSLPGLLLDSLVGAGVGRLVAEWDTLRVGKVNLGTFIGLIIGMITKVSCAPVTVLILLSVWTFDSFIQP